ncbi:uncharacterized protein BT62DRAFT_908782 [Guyanagaster necrorhizus]|uniref:Uncharacterized protein n=1 Tax=Guyanagaster necrorhizus TaxID=856835 RepID=A0A9P8AN02_9AGAR|nr:uncharacterized protein BT62DRAFT_908782 [Guyanagaster necrorhizus MCA 3950]KAG7441246.1 hypothetical protein BT62DRAFT_908782 [Guyanagaster necrorhizus MCA 3950]
MDFLIFCPVFPVSCVPHLRRASTKTCNIQGTGNIRYLASGWIWFNYDSETRGHYKC